MCIKKNRMRTLAALLLVFCTLTNVKAQSSGKTRYFSIELGGAGLAASFNYDHLIFQKNNHKLWPRVGVGYMPLLINGKLTTGTWGIIAGVNYLYSFDHHQAVAGFSNNLTTTFLHGSGDPFRQFSVSYLMIPRIGYRYQDFNSKYFLGAGFSPVISFNGFSLNQHLMQYKNHFYITIGLSL